jgi:hypothetical protein
VSQRNLTYHVKTVTEMAEVALSTGRRQQGQAGKPEDGRPGKDNSKKR